MAAFIQIAAVAILLYWCFTLVSPFVTVVIWALILSVALYPAHVRLTARLGGREKLSATVLVLIGLTVLAVPCVMLADSTVGALHAVAAELEDGTAQIRRRQTRSQTGLSSAKRCTRSGAQPQRIWRRQSINSGHKFDLPATRYWLSPATRLVLRSCLHSP